MKLLSILGGLIVFGGVIVSATSWQNAQDAKIQANASNTQEVLYWKCVRECRETCARNGIPESACDCSHCRDELEP